jgi:hypothetical protein
MAAGTHPQQTVTMAPRKLATVTMEGEGVGVGESPL